MMPRQNCPVCGNFPRITVQNGLQREVAALRAEKQVLESRIAELEVARAKAQGPFWDKMCRVQFQGDGMIYRGTACAIAMDADATISAQAAELADLREQCRGMEIRETAGNGIIIEQTAKIDEQARELERLRRFAAQAGEAALASGDEVRVRLTSALVNLDRAHAAQEEPQTTPCTGAEFLEAAHKAIEPRSDEEIREIIADLEKR